MIPSVNSNSEQAKTNHFQEGTIFQAEFVWQRMTPYFVSWKLSGVVTALAQVLSLPPCALSEWLQRRQQTTGEKCPSHGTSTAVTSVPENLEMLLRASPGLCIQHACVPVIGPALKMVGEKFCFPLWKYCSDRGGSGIIVDSDILDQSSFKLIAYFPGFTEHCRQQHCFVDLGLPY